MNSKSVCLATGSIVALSIALPNEGHAQSELPTVTVVALPRPCSVTWLFRKRMKAPAASAQRVT
jgi:hypothetical protein